MSSSSSLPGEFTSGALFGAALLAAGVYSPEIIKAQMLFQSNTMVTVMMGASAVSAIVLDIQDRLGFLPKKIRPTANLGFFEYDGNLVGGLLLGLGMGITGACPGTALVQLGVGQTNGLLVVLGGVMGAMAHSAARRKLIENQSACTTTAVTTEPTASTAKTQPPPSPLDFPTLLHLTPLTLLLIYIPLCLTLILLLFAIDPSVRSVPATGLVPPVYSGLLIGTAQLATTALAGHAIGASSAFSDVGESVSSAMGRSLKRAHQEPNPAKEQEHETAAAGKIATLFTPGVVFSLGVVCAAAALNQSTTLPPLRPASTAILSSPTLLLRQAARAVLGGGVMVFGSRVAGGCTSGHGISGFAGFSVASAVAMVGVFGGGVLGVNVARGGWGVGW